MVNWQNYPKDQSTWEPKSSIPEDIIKEFEKDLMTKKISTKEKITKKGNILKKELISPTNTPTRKIKTKLKIEENSSKKSKRKLKQTLVDLESNTKAVKILKRTNKLIKKTLHSPKLNKIKRSKRENKVEKKGLKKRTVKNVNIGTKKKIKQKYKRSIGKESTEKTGSKLHQKGNNPAPIKGVVYTIESLVEKKGTNYLVKWENFPESQNTWEPSSAIPSSILKVQLFLNINYSFNIDLI